MEPSRQTSSESAPAAAELVVQNGRQSGTRRQLGHPLTFLGRARGCDIRLNVDGIEPLHCLLVRCPDGLLLRDLDSASGTLVNGTRLASASLHDGDVLSIGPFQFRLHLPSCLPLPTAADKPPPADNPADTTGQQEALRILIAALAAQQMSLGEEEARLQQQRGALEQQQEQLATHLEEKQRRLTQLTECTQVERQALESDRATCEKHLEQATGALQQGQRQLAQSQQKLLTKRRRLAELHQRLRQRWQSHWAAQGQKIKAVEQELARQTGTLEKTAQRLGEQEKALADKQAQLHREAATARSQVQSAQDLLQQAQQQWRQRRRRERAVLKARARQLDLVELQLEQAQKQQGREVERWQKQRQRLEQEIEGLQTRSRNLRHKALQQQQEVARVEQQLRQRPQQLRAGDGAALPAPAVPASHQETPGGLASRPAPAAAVANQDTPSSWQQWAPQLQRLAGDLADQRLELAEQWQRLLLTQDSFQQERDQAANELEARARQLQQQEQAQAQREQAQAQLEAVGQRRHEELVKLRQQLTAWRARLRIREASWEGERQRLLAELQAREELANRHLNALVDLRRRWADRRQQELDLVQADRASWAQLRQEIMTLRQEWTRRLAQLEDQRRTQTEKELALEQWRPEVGQGDWPSAQRRLERLRRSWILQNAAALRSWRREREAAKEELARLDARFAELQKRSGDVAVAQARLAEEWTACEHKQVLANARQSRMQHELQALQARSTSAEEQIDRMKEEMERMTSSLVDDGNLPTLPLDRAA